MYSHLFCNPIVSLRPSFVYICSSQQNPHPGTCRFLQRPNPMTLRPLGVVTFVSWSLAIDRPVKRGSKFALVAKKYVYRKEYKLQTQEIFNFIFKAGLYSWFYCRGSEVTF
jgi:hypothetical protein